MVELRGWLREKKAVLLSVVPLVAISVLGSVYFDHNGLSSSVNVSPSIEVAPDLPDEPLLHDGQYQIENGQQFIFLKGVFHHRYFLSHERFTAMSLTDQQKYFILTLLNRGAELSSEVGGQKAHFPIEVFVGPVYDKRIKDGDRFNDYAYTFVYYGAVSGRPERCILRIPGHSLPIEFFTRPEEPIPQQLSEYTDSFAFTLGWHEVDQHCRKGKMHYGKPRFSREEEVREELGLKPNADEGLYQYPLWAHRKEAAWWDLSFNPVLPRETALHINSVVK